ncbi:MAG: metallophosphoesterase, partial [Pseudomonadota bacterium]
MNTWVIGDVQGCYDDLQRLLDKVQFSDSDRLWFAGDLVNRGTQSLATLEFVKYLADRAVCVLGNHDLHLLAAANGARPAGKSDTFGDVLNSPHREELLEWLRLQPLIVSKDQHTMVHAGIY